MSCCSKSLFVCEELTLPKQSYNGSELRIDGYYYLKYYPSENEIYYSTYFLFQNGIILYGGAVKETELSRLENDFISYEWINTVRKHRDFWGVFNIKDDKILFERWYPNSPQPVPYIREGKILNDTTFHITVLYRPDGSERSELNDIYHFKQFSPKPDSTNNFIP